jgi:hypothetical protein
MVKNKWEILGTFDGEIWIGNKDGYGPLVKARSQKIAEYTIKCVNSHDALVEACKAAEDFIRGHIVAIHRPASLDKMLMDAIEQAEKEGG